MRPPTKSAPAVKARLVLNMLLSTSSPLVLIPFDVSTIEIIYMPITQMANTKPIRSIKGIS